MSGSETPNATPDPAESAPAPMARKIILISTNFGQNMGGEAIKAYQYAKYLEARGYELLIITHGRCREEVEAEFAPERYWIIDDDWVQVLFWKSVLLRTFLNIWFHVLVRRRIQAAGLDPEKHILHFIGPVSPVAVRLPAPGFDVVMGPFTGNIYYPPAFRHRMPLKDRLRESLHVVSQWTFGKIFGDKRRAKAVLVSGYERTRASLSLAGCSDEQMIDVVDAGVSERLCALSRVVHDGDNPAFMCSGRLVDHKGVDLAIKAVAKCPSRIRLDVFGDGVKRAEWEQLARDLGVADRVRFLGWQPYDDLIASFANYRGYLFPSLAEANGIVMQEAMMIGLPVVTVRWGGPSRLAADDSAMYVDPIDEDHVVAGIAEALQKLADDPALAEEISLKARKIAETRFPWDAVAASWAEAYRS